MAEALDLDQLVAAVSNGTGAANPSMVSMDSIYYSDVQKKKITTDLEKAKADLANPATTASRSQSSPTSAAMYQAIPAAVVAQAMMQQVGLNVQIEVLDYATQVDRRRSGKYQVISQSVTPRLDPALMYSFYVGNKDKNASLMWDNPKAIELMESAYKEADQSKRQAIFDQFHELMLEEVPGIFLYDLIDIWGASKKLHGTPVWQSNVRVWEVSLDN